MDTKIYRIIKCLGVLLVLATMAGFSAGLADGMAENGSSTWRDDFESQELDPAWFWVNEVPGQWSLSEAPGFMRIRASSYPTGGENLLLRVADGDFMIKTRLLFAPDTNFQFAGLVIWQDQDNFLQFGRAFCDAEGCIGDGLYFDHIADSDWVGGNFPTPLDGSPEVDLRLERRGEMVKAFYSLDQGISWVEVGTHWIPPDIGVFSVGLTASQDYNTPEWDIPADFGFFELSDGEGFLPEGYHDFDSGEVVSWSCNAGGWAADPDDRSERIAVEIVVDHQTVTTMTAQEFREDLLEAEVCEGGNCSFFHSLWGEISSYEPHDVAVWAQDFPSGQWVLLRNSPLGITCRTYDIYAFDLRTGETSLVSNLPDMHEYNPKWSPDGRRLVHDAWSLDWSEHGIYLTDIPTGTSTLIPGADRGSYPAWSPNGRWIAFDRGADNDYRLFIVPPGGGDPQLVIEDAFMASWAPSSQRLVYNQPSDGSLRTVKLDGSHQTLVTELGNGPVWSPNGQWIAYEVSGNLWKVRVNPQGVPLGKPVQLTSWSAWEGRPTWSPDSRTIVFHTDLAGEADIWSIPADGGQPIWLTGAPNLGDYDPNYARDSRRIAYAGASPNGQAPRPWVSAYTYDYGTWFEGDHKYHFEAEWSGGDEITDEINFYASSGAELYPKYVLLRPGAVRAGPECQAIGEVNLDQPTRFLVGYLTDGEMTYPEAQIYFAALEARAVWDDGESAQLMPNEILPFMPDNWFQYVCDFTESKPSPHFTVFPEWEWFDGLDWPDGSYVTITVEGKDGCEVTRQSWGGFFNGGFPEGCDLEIGDIVVFENDETTRAHTVQNLAVIEVDIEHNTVAGTADPFAEIYVWPHATGEQIMVTAGETGAWNVDFTGVFDLVPGECGRSEIRDEMGNATAADWCTPDTRFTVFPKRNYLEGYEWPDGAVVSISVAGKETCTTEAVSGYPEWDPTNTFFTIDFPEDCAIEAGDLITLVSGSLSFSHQVQELDITEIDQTSDTVSGIAFYDPEQYLLHTWIDGIDGSYMQLSTEDGDWLADFGSQGFDLQPGMSGRVELVDQASNATAVEWNILSPRLIAFPAVDQIFAYNWPDDSEVSLTINGEYIATANVQGAPWDPNDIMAFFDFSSLYDLIAEDEVTLSGSGMELTYTVQNLSVTEVNEQADTVSGTADYSALVHAGVFEWWDVTEMQLTAEDGTWLADFGSLGFDLSRGMCGRAEIWDETGNSTAVDWCIPQPSFAAYMPSTIEGYDWPLGSEISLDINGGEYTATATSEQRPGFPEGETRVLFELWRDSFVLEVGDHIVLTDGVGMKELWVADLHVLDINPRDHTVSGIYDPERSFWIQLEGQEPLDLQFDGNTWVATFEDMTPEAWGYVAQDDFDHDGTVWDFQIPRFVNSSNFYVEWHPINPEEIVEFRWKDSDNLTQTWTHALCPDDLEFFGNSWVSENEGAIEFFFASLVGWGTTGSWTNLEGVQVEIGSISSGCPGSADIPVQTNYQFFDDEGRANLVRIERIFEFGETPYDHALRPYIPRLYPADGFTQVIHPDAAGTSLVTDGTCGFGCQAGSWDGSWFAIHNPDTGQGMIVLHIPSDYSAALWLDDDAGSFTNASSVLLLPPPGGFTGTLTESEYLCFYDSGTWEPSTSLPDGCQP